MHLHNLSRYLYFFAALAFLISAYAGDNNTFYVLAIVFFVLGITKIGREKKKNIPDSEG